MVRAIHRKAEAERYIMKSIFKVIKQGEPQQVASQKAEGGQLNKCMITLQEWGDKYGNTFVCTLLGNSALCRWSAGDIVLASLRFQAREYNGQWYQDITGNDILTAN